MIGTKLYKKTDDMKRYSKTAMWCNTNNAHIEDKGDDYEAVDNEEYVRSNAELITELTAKYEANKELLIGYITEAVAYGDDVEDLRTELIALDEQFDAEMAELKGGEE